jgi:hypothetical protein
VLGDRGEGNGEDDPRRLTSRQQIEGISYVFFLLYRTEPFSLDPTRERGGHGVRPGGAQATNRFCVNKNGFANQQATEKSLTLSRPAGPFDSFHNSCTLS